MDKRYAEGVASHDVSKYLDTVASGADSLEKIEALRVLQGEIEDNLYGWVVAARASGRTWEAIGNALGMSKQAAQQRFGRSRI